MSRSTLGFLMLVFAASHALPKPGYAQRDEQAAGSDSIKREHYLLLAAENTPLQKYLAGRQNGGTDYAAHLLVDGQALRGDEQLNLKAIDWAQLKEDLQAIDDQKLVKQKNKNQRPALMIHTYFTGNPGEDSDFVNWTLGGFARQAAHFGVVNLSSTYSAGGVGLWEQFDAIVGERATLVDASADESPKENDYVQVFPVRTFLSRLRTDNADCVVVIKPKFSEDFSEGLPRSIKTSMSVFSRQLQFEEKGRVLFSFGYSRGGEEAKDWFMREGAREMQHALGFRSSVITIGYQ